MLDSRLPGEEWGGAGEEGRFPAENRRARIESIERARFESSDLSLMSPTSIASLLRPSSSPDLLPCLCVFNAFLMAVLTNLFLCRSSLSAGAIRIKKSLDQPASATHRGEFSYRATIRITQLSHLLAADQPLPFNVIKDTVPSSARQRASCVRDRLAFP